MYSSQELEPILVEELLVYNLMDLASEGLEYMKPLTGASLLGPQDKTVDQVSWENVQKYKKENHAVKPLCQMAADGEIYKYSQTCTGPFLNNRHIHSRSTANKEKYR